MYITTFGTRGSLPVAGPDKLKFGGNTTCLQVESNCIPPGTVLSVDAGSGFLPLSREALAAGMKRLVIFHTHFHHDHTLGVVIAPPVYIDSLPIDIVGPVDKKKGPRDVYQTLMSPPLHPVPFKKVARHLKFHSITNPAQAVILFHPRGGMHVLDRKKFERAEKKSGQVELQKGKNFLIDECMVVTMHYTAHPERTLAYRFEERPTKKSFVFLTDEEVRKALPASFKKFLADADLIIQDAQFGESMYKSMAAGWGHGTPEYAMMLAHTGKIKRVGLTHHDPTASDSDVDNLLAEAKASRREFPSEVFACYDHLRIEV